MKDLNGIELGLLQIDRTFDAPIDDVFAALTQPELMAQWFHAFPEGSAIVEADLRVGGKYSIEMLSASDQESSGGCGGGSVHHGEYLEISPPSKLSFTWIKDGFVDYSVVTIELKPAGESTALTLTHHVPADKVAPHTQGWNACLDNLERFAS